MVFRCSVFLPADVCVHDIKSLLLPDWGSLHMNCGGIACMGYCMIRTKQVPVQL